MEEPTYIRYRPKDNGSDWIVLPIDAIEQLQSELHHSEVGEVYEVEALVMTEKEYRELPEHQGF